MAVTASTMLLRALQMVNFKAPGDTLTTTEQTIHLYNLNSMLDSWSIDILLCYQRIEENFALTTSQGVYTIGPSGNFNTARPTDIVDPCFIRDSSNNDYPIEILDAVAYGRITLKTVDGSYPRYLYYDGSFVAPGLATVKLFPEPSASLTLYINSWKQLPKFDSISAPLMMPPGYQLAIESNYAVHACAGIRPVSTETAKIARDSKAAVESANLKDSILRMPAGIGTGQRWSIYAG